MLIVAASSCTRRVYVPVESTVYHTDTLRRTLTRTDSVYVRDSVAVVARGDTVIVERWRDRYRCRYHTDTLWRTATDSVRVETRVPVPVERRLTRWEKTKQAAGGVAIGALAAVLAVAAFRIAGRFKRQKT